jgi:hypothetical protein
MAAAMKQFYKLSELPRLSRNTTAILGSKPEGRTGVQVVPITPIYDSENAWMMTCVITGKRFSPIQVPSHFLQASVCSGAAYKKWQSRQPKQKAK